MAKRDIVAELTAELNDATRRARQLVDRTDGRVFTVRPDPKRWSAAECISHLTLTGQAFVPIIQGAIVAAKKSGSKPKRRPRMDVIGGVLRWLMEPPIKRRVRTAPPFVPRAARPKAEAFAEFASLQSQLMYEALEASEIDFGSVMVVSAFNRRVHYNLYSAFRIIAAHERRHLWQAENAVDEVMKRFTPAARNPVPSSSLSETR
jgi:hypothetical protein